MLFITKFGKIKIMRGRSEERGHEKLNYEGRAASTLGSISYTPNQAVVYTDVRCFVVKSFGDIAISVA